MAQTDFMTTAEFRCSFPEFKSVQDPQISAYLTKARQRVDPTVLGNRLNQAHGLLTADLLAGAPFGQQARMTSEEGMTTYRKQFQQLICETVLGDEGDTFSSLAELLPDTIFTSPGGHYPISSSTAR